jgi:hypothetical protein
MNPATDVPLIGILVMDAHIRRIPGDVGNPETFPFPVAYRTVPGATLARLIRQRDPSLVAPFVRCGQELVRAGARALTTTCGFMVLLQEALARELPVPIFTSSLLQLPFIQAGLDPGGRVGVLTADAGNLTDDHLRAAGGDPARISLAGLESSPHFRNAILEGSGSIDPDAVRAEVVRAAEALVAAAPGIRAILLECSNLPPYAAAVQKAVGLPVYDFTTMLGQVWSALTRRPFAPAG